MCSAPKIDCTILVLANECMPTNNLSKIEKQYHQPKLLKISSLEQVARAITKWVY